MRFVTKFGALLAALFLAVLPACALPLNSITMAHHGAAWVFIIGSLAGLAGTVVVTYAWPVQGTTPPTIAQAKKCSIQSALIQMADADTQAAFTHNWGVPASFPSYFLPIVIMGLQAQANPASTLALALTTGVTNTNVVFINKVSSVGSGGTFVVHLLRPHSLIR
jgi:hypothetical protein